MLTFDFDAETLWISRNPENINRPGVLSQGKYGAQVGVPKILEVLRDFGIKSTFFVPGWTAEKHTAKVGTSSRTAMVGHHGYLHEWITPDKPDEELASFDRGLEALQRTVGVRPKGYRSPAGETSPNMFRIMADYGFLYDSSMMDHVNPYRHVLEDGRFGPVELPWHGHGRRFCALFDRDRAIFSNEQSKWSGGTSSGDLQLRAGCSTWSCTRNAAGRAPFAPARDDRLHPVLPRRVVRQRQQSASLAGPARNRRLRRRLKDGVEARPGPRSEAPQGAAFSRAPKMRVRLPWKYSSDSG
jgi:hypothetical protein